MAIVTQLMLSHHEPDRKRLEVSVVYDNGILLEVLGFKVQNDRVRQGEIILTQGTRTVNLDMIDQRTTDITRGVWTGTRDREGGVIWPFSLAFIP